MSNPQSLRIFKFIAVMFLVLAFFTHSTQIIQAQTEEESIPTENETQFREITISNFAKNIYSQILSGIRFTFSTVKQATSDIISIKPAPTPEPGIVSAIKKASSAQNQDGSTSNISNPNNTNPNNTIVVPRRSSGSSGSSSGSGPSGSSSSGAGSSSGSGTGSTSSGTRKTTASNPTPSITATASPRQTPNSTPRSTPSQTPTNTNPATASPASTPSPSPTNTASANATPASTPTATPSTTPSPNASPTNSPQARLNVQTASIIETFATVIDYIEAFSRQNNSILQKK
jgi:cell division septation protein DedD